MSDDAQRPDDAPAGTEEGQQAVPVEAETAAAEAAPAEQAPAEQAPAEQASAEQASAEEAPAEAAAPAASAASARDAARAENTLILELKDGKVAIELLPDLAPLHVARIRQLARAGFYDGTPFHRVIEGFMAQGGDPTGTGTGGARDKGFDDLPAEFSPPGRARFVRGACGMARAQNPNSANSQFFIMFAAAASLDGQYTIWGRVVSGMETVDRIKRGSGAHGIVQQPDLLISARIAADLPAA